MRKDIVFGIIFLLLMVGGMAWGALHLALIALILGRLAWGALRKKS